MSQPHRTDNPFPGLRSFTPEEDHLFFGREEQTMELLQKLGTQPLRGRGRHVRQRQVLARAVRSALAIARRQDAPGRNPLGGGGHSSKARSSSPAAPSRPVSCNGC